MEVYKIQVDKADTLYTVYVTESAKVLETCLSYHNGLQSRYIADPIVDLPDGWIDAQSSCQSLGWMTEDDLLEWDAGSSVSVGTVEYHHPLNAKRLIATPNDIGDRVCISPSKLLETYGH